MQIRNVGVEDLDDVLKLYRSVADIPSGLARPEAEVDRDYVAGFRGALDKSISHGVALLAIYPRFKHWRQGKFDE